ncbi:MAG TPA: mannosyltransferase family protein [Anaerolineales bacterium]|nr:mannosyltransferase family protein [Anaerolineales bacterium]
MLPMKGLPSMRWKKEWTGFLLLVLSLRVLYGAIGVWVVRSGGPIPLQEPVYAEMKPYLQTGVLSENLINPWFQWDTISFLKIAILGYERDATVAFMPLYPLAIRWGGAILGGRYLLAALLVSTLCAFLTLVMMFELFRKQFTEEIAWQAVLIFLSFPTAFYLLAGYTESLFLGLVLAFWILAENRWWGWAGLVAGLATLTRFQGMILSIMLLWMMLSTVWSREKRLPLVNFDSWVEALCTLPGRVFRAVPPAAWLAVLVPPVVAFSYQFWLAYSGYGTLVQAYAQFWHMETVPPWIGVMRILQQLPTWDFLYIDWIDLFLLIVVAFAAVLAPRRLSSAFSLYIWLTLAVFFSRWTPHFLLGSFSRYFLTLFPLALLPALSNNRYLRVTVIVLFFALHIVLVTIFLWGSWVS